VKDTRRQQDPQKHCDPSPEHVFLGVHRKHVSATSESVQVLSGASSPALGHSQKAQAAGKNDLLTSLKNINI